MNKEHYGISIILWFIFYFSLNEKWMVLLTDNLVIQDAFFFKAKSLSLSEWE